MKKANSEFSHSVPCLRVSQWLREWDLVDYDPASHKRKPNPDFYLCSISASHLRALAGIYPRSVKDGQRRASDLGIQRRHDVARSEQIRKYIRFGYPWSDLSSAKRVQDSYRDLRKPGWLPTAIVVNVLLHGDRRRGASVDASDLVTISETGACGAELALPAGFKGPTWRPKGLHPIEVIDGQHRLWAFDEEALEGDFQLPVVAFYGLDLSWQAYLFWTINISPKRINASLAFDLYPLLRNEVWLDRFEGHSVYREARAQELTELLWSSSFSPWHHRINMLGESGLGKQVISQAAWIRSLVATFVKSSEGPGVTIGGLFGAPVGSDQELLAWTRLQQAAFLIFAGEALRAAIAADKSKWSAGLRASPSLLTEDDPAFFGAYSLLTTDPGIRGFLFVVNDLTVLRADELALESWDVDGMVDGTDDAVIGAALKSIRKTKIADFIEELAAILSTFDWRASSAPDLTSTQRTQKAALRGSGGYKLLRRSLLHHIATYRGDVGTAAIEAIRRLKY